MKHRNVCMLLAIVAILLFGGLALAANIRWKLPTTYTDGSAISADNQAKITVEVFTGPSATGPWTSAGTAAAGATSATAPDPAAGGTLWYNAKATLNGKTSDYGVAKSATLPFRTPGAPTEIIVTLE